MADMLSFSYILEKKKTYLLFINHIHTASAHNRKVFVMHFELVGGTKAVP